MKIMQLGFEITTGEYLLIKKAVSDYCCQSYVSESEKQTARNIIAKFDGKF